MRGNPEVPGVGVVPYFLRAVPVDLDIVIGLLLFPNLNVYCWNVSSLYAATAVGMIWFLISRF